MRDRSGQQLGNYRMIRLLGRGGFADVYLGEHIYLKTQAAIKVLQTKVADEKDLESFLQEARTIAHLTHPHIVRIMDFGVHEETPFLVMDYATHGTMRQRYPKGVSLSLKKVVPYVKQIAAALQYAHDEKVIHRDVKPENMLLDRNDEVLLGDFGIALLAQSSRYQSTQDVTGTVGYMSPEQIQGKPRAASDQYSLGIVIYEWLSGDRPFHGSFTELCTQHMFAPPPALREKLPTIVPGVEQVIMTALAKDPRERFGSIRAFAHALEQASRPIEPVVLAPKPVEPPFAPKQGATSPQTPVLRVPPPPPPIPAKVEKRMPSAWSPQPQANALPKMSPSLNERPARKGRFALVLFCLFIGILTVIDISVVTTSMQHYASSATAQTNLDATATATVVAANPNPYPPTKGTLALYDPLSQLDNNWDNGVDSSFGGACQFIQGAYHVSQSKPNANYLCKDLSISSDFSNFAFEVQMTITKGDCGGIVFRYDDTKGSDYFFWVCQNGSYALVLYPNYTGNNTKTLSSGFSQAIHTGYNQSNVIAVVANGSSLDLYINNQRIGSANDTVYSHGTIALCAVDNGQPTEVIYRNAKVWTF